MKGLIRKKRGQVWVETVIYTLIGLSIIGILLAVATPKINEMKDRLRINEAIDILSTIDTKISEVKSSPSNIRVYDLTIAKGKVVLNATNNSITWIVDTNYKYSEPGVEWPLGELKIKTIEDGGYYHIYLKRELDVDLTVDGSISADKTLETASVPYPLVIKSVGSSSSFGSMKVDISTK